MFDQKTVDAYKTIQPSAQLQQRIADVDAAGNLQQMKPPKLQILYRGAGIAAACLALVLAAALFVHRAPAQLALYAEGQAVAAGHSAAVPQANAQLRAFTLAPQEETMTVCLTRAAASQLSLSVSEGSISCYDAQSGQALEAANLPKGEIQLYWTIDMPDTQGEFRLYAAAQEKTLCYVLYFDISENQWMIYQENEKE